MALVKAVQAAVEALALAPADQGAVELALAYAAEIDHGETPIDKVGPALLTVMEALGATPRARAALAKGVTSVSSTSPLDELRARRNARINRAEDLDTAAP